MICPKHNVEFVLRPAGISQATKMPYKAFWACPSPKTEQGYCQEKPPSKNEMALERIEAKVDEIKRMLMAEAK